MNKKARKRAVPAAGLILLALSAAAAVYLNTPFGYLPILAVLFAGALSLLYAALLRRFLVLEGIEGTVSCFRGETAELRLGVRNASALLCPGVEAVFALTDLFGNTSETSVVSFPLAPREVRSFPVAVRFDHVGLYHAGLEEVRIQGLFGLFSLRLSVRSACRVEVSPRVHPLDDLSLSDAALAEQQRAWRRSSAESLDYAGVREYAFGDPIKRVHWKLSAHSTGYLTKLMESYGSSGISILLDLESPVYPPEVLMDVYDCLTETAVSLCAAAHEEGMEYELMACDRRGERRRWTPGDLTAFGQTVGELPPISTEAGPDVLEFLREEGRSLYGQPNLAVCTPRLTEELVQLLLELQGRGKRPLVFFVLPDTLTEKARGEAMRPTTLLGAAGIPCYVLSGTADLERGRCE